ncbi:hypothetical protein LOTGIDRAFT_171133 [Lottia gigantea]|uniref:RING-type domain-containing protein n=1 Tax=Lottia gigantea TaxID=225164 RepID=V4BEC4_LOTGI|nr:hypothetical protein LOTGIDRAFT_171133 [Lottia gigantea]ESP04137.1 hypothetical protein LOTGIDRAFT_171133 [Lottia gigantea]
MARGLLPNLPGNINRPINPRYHHLPSTTPARDHQVSINMLDQPNLYTPNSPTGPPINIPRFDLQQQLASMHPMEERPRPPSPPDEGPGVTGADGQLDWRLLINRLQNCGIFIILLFLKLMYDHRLGLLIFLALGGTFYYVNQRLVSSIHQFLVKESGNKGNLVKLFGLIVYLAINISFVFYMFSGQALWKSLIFQTPNVADFDIWTLLWVVLINDYMIKFSTVILKCFITMLPNQLIKHKRRGKYYMFIEYVSQCYRQLVPIIPWMHFLSDDQHSGKWFASFEVILYLLFKVNIVWMSIRDLQKAFQRFRVHNVFGGKPSSEDIKQHGESCPIYFISVLIIGIWWYVVVSHHQKIKNSMVFGGKPSSEDIKQLCESGPIYFISILIVFGGKPSSEDIKQRGESCPICQDELKDPVILSCKHIFCEDCVSVWFDRERTCPMCRAQITDYNPQFQDGATAMHLQWY